MTEPIDVQSEPAPGGWTSRVEVGGPDASTTHVVNVSAADLARLAPGAPDPDDLVRRSFVFLLAREPKETILGRFDLMVIARYFPEYEREITGQGRDAGGSAR
jgi:hypothetical protein